MWISEAGQIALLSYFETEEEIGNPHWTLKMSFSNFCAFVWCQNWCYCRSVMLRKSSLLSFLLNYWMYTLKTLLYVLTLFDMGGGGIMPPKMFLTTVPKRFGGGSWNLVTFNIHLWGINKSYFWLPRLSSVTMATSLSEGTRDFLKLSFHMFPYNEILKVFKNKIWVGIWRKHLKIPLNTKFQQNQSGGFGVTSIWNLGLCVG